VAKEIFAHEGQPAPDVAASPSPDTAPGIKLKGVPWRWPIPPPSGPTQAAGEGRETMTELNVRFVQHEQFDSAPLPINKFCWPFVYIYAAVSKVSFVVLFSCGAGIAPTELFGPSLIFAVFFSLGRKAKATVCIELPSRTGSPQCRRSNRSCPFCFALPSLFLLISVC